MHRSHFGLWALLALLAAPCVAWAADPAEDHPFGTIRDGLRADRYTRLRGADVVMLRLPPARQPGLGARIGLHGSNGKIQKLPGPAGRWHVRVTNPGKRPLLVPAGEAMLTPSGPSRLTDRAVWIAAGSATFVSVVQVVEPAPDGPYLSRGRGLTPTEQGIVDLDRLRARIRFRNRVMGVPAHRLDDAAAAYTTKIFGERIDRYRNALLGLAEGQSTVGFVVAGENGPHYAHVETDAARFKARWPALVDGLALDAMLVVDANLSAQPGSKGELMALIRKAVAGIGRTSLQRPNLGRGTEHRWLVPGENALWTGLDVDGDPVYLTLHRHVIAVKNGPPGNGPGPGGTGEGGETDSNPGLAELERRKRLTPYEQRLRDRMRDRQPSTPQTRPTPRPRSRPRPTPVPSPTPTPTPTPTPRPAPPTPSPAPVPGPTPPTGPSLR